MRADLRIRVNNSIDPVFSFKALLLVMALTMKLAYPFLLALEWMSEYLLGPM
jgi:hypothetical protein